MEVDDDISNNIVGRSYYIWTRYILVNIQGCYDTETKF